jgi:hypothetical protein
MELRRNHTNSHLEAIWNGLHKARTPWDDVITEDEWDDICTAMVWITEDLGVDVDK